jgi:hypothetical protein
MSPKMFIVGPPGSAKSTAFPVSGFGVDFFNADDRDAALNQGCYLNIPRAIREQVNLKTAVRRGHRRDDQGFR